MKILSEKPPENWQRCTLTFEMPDPGLFWNRRTHHQALARLKKESRRTGWLVAEKWFRDVILPETYVWRGYKIEPHFPNNRRHDDDNFAGACKGILDGVFIDYLQTDDSGVKFLGVEKTVDKGCRPHFLLHLYYEEL